MAARCSGSIRWALQLNLETTYGQTQGSFEFAGFEITNQGTTSFNVAVSLSWRDLLVRFAETDVNTQGSVPLNGQMFSLNVHDHFHCVGLQYDDGQALLMSEWSRRDESNLPGLNRPLVNESSWYVATGWRFGKFTPLAMYSVFNVTKTLLGDPLNSHTWNASLRYDVLHNVDLKLQVSRAQARNGAYWLVSDRASDQWVNVYSFGADFVF